MILFVEYKHFHRAVAYNRYPFQRGDLVFSDIYRRHILTSEFDPRTERVNYV